MTIRLFIKIMHMHFSEKVPFCWELLMKPLSDLLQNSHRLFSEVAPNEPWVERTGIDKRRNYFSSELRLLNASQIFANRGRPV